MTTQELTAALSAPFEVREIKWKPQSVKGNRALAVAYIDCRVVQERLDAVLGVDGWQDDYEILADGSVVCRLQIHCGEKWVTKTDVGSPSEQPDGGDRLKAAFSDALKRAAVKYGVGRYIYRLPPQWADYDVAGKKFASAPQLPAWAMPKGTATAPPKQQAQASATQPAQQAAAPAKTPAPAAKPANGLPADGKELLTRLKAKDAKLAAERKCSLGALVAYVAQAGLKGGFGDDISKWSGVAIPYAVGAVKAFEETLSHRAPQPHRTDNEMDLLLEQHGKTWQHVVRGVNHMHKTQHQDATQIPADQLDGYFDWLAAQEVAAA